MAYLLHELILDAAARTPDAPALADRGAALTYAELADRVTAAARALLRLGLGRGERVAVYLDKRLETVVALFGASAAGGVFVPVNPLLKGEQVGHILRDCNVRILVTSAERAETLHETLGRCPDLHTLVVLGESPAARPHAHIEALPWGALADPGDAPPAHRAVDADIASILYTSGSTGMPKGVVLSHRNMMAGAQSVADYLGNVPDDRLLAVLPLSFDAGFSQLSTAFLTGASVVLMNYLLPQDVPRAVVKHAITGIGAVPPLWIPLSRLTWPEEAIASLRYITNTGGAMPRATLQALRQALPRTQVFLMYGLTEAFRSTYLPPAELDRRPDSMGRAIPNNEILVVRPDGSLCAPNEPGELVHRGALVAQGYWNDPERTAERFKPAPGRPAGVVRPEVAVWSGDLVRMDEEGYLYFIGRQDDMIKTSGYRVSSTEVEEVLYGGGLVAEAVAVGVPHPVLGQGIVAVVVPAEPERFSEETLLDQCRRALPNFMVPARVAIREHLPRNPNGKIDRNRLARELADVLAAE